MPVGDGEEDELAGVALEHHTTADRHRRVGVLAGSEVGAERPNVGCAVGAIEAVRVRLAAGGAQVVDLLLATGALGGEPAPGDRRPVVLVGSITPPDGTGFGPANPPSLSSLRWRKAVPGQRVTR